MIGNIVLVVIVVGLIWMWRRRAGRRTAKATEAIAGILAPIPGPGGSYPKPVRGRHRSDASLGMIEGVDRICLVCGRVTGQRASSVGRALLVDVCGGCEAERAAS